MSVGIYDLDLYTYTQIPLNLDVMKLSAYYKKQKEIVLLVPKFAPDKHTKFIMCKDYDDDIKLPDLSQYTNIECRGLYFSANRYIPLPIEIEKMKPDTSIYKKAEVIYKTKGLKTAVKLFNKMMGAQHCRLSLDGKTIWKDYKSQVTLKGCRTLMLHDENLGQIEGALEEVERIVKNHSRLSIATKHPILVNTEEEFLRWLKIPASDGLFTLVYNGILTPKSFNIYTQYSTYSFRGQTEFNLSKVPKDWLLGDGARNLLRQALISRIWGHKFLLTGIDEIMIKAEWKNYFYLLNNFSNAHQKINDSLKEHLFGKMTLYDYVKWLKQVNYIAYRDDCINKDKAAETFECIRKENPILIREFYECCYDKIIQEGEYDK